MFPSEFQFNLSEDRPKPKVWEPRFKKHVQRVEVKRDGYRTTIIVGTDRAYRAVQGKTEDVWPKIKHATGIPLGLPAETILDGELEAPGRPASEVSTAMANGEPLHFICFGVPFFGGEDTRLRTLAWRDQICFINGIETPVVVPFEKATQKYAEELGVEGFVFKQFHYRNWWKLKRVDTVDVIITGATPGMGKFKGRNGSLAGSVYNAKGNIQCIAWIGKGKDALWRDLSFQEYNGRVAEISHEGMQKFEFLKFSSFVRWRDDKLPKDCHISQITRKA